MPRPSSTFGSLLVATAAHLCCHTAASTSSASSSAATAAALHEPSRTSRRRRHRYHIRQQHGRRRRQLEFNVRRRLQQVQMEGTCVSSELASGQLLERGSYLCYPLEDPVYKFGIDSSNELSFFVDDIKLWHATPPPNTETSACSFFGNCPPPSLEYFRLQNPGSLAAYTSDRKKVWDGFVDGGEYTPEGLDWLRREQQQAVEGVDGAFEVPSLVVGPKSIGSVLTVDEEGVTIMVEDTGVVTWRIVAPEIVAEEPTNTPTARVTASPTASPVKAPSPPPTTAAVGSIVEGFVWDDTSTNDAVYGPAGDVPLPSIPVSLHQCADDEYVNSTMTIADGTFRFEGFDVGRYKLRVTPPGGLGEGATWKVVARDANDDAEESAAVDSDAYEDGTSDCIDVGVAGGSLQHSFYAGLIEASSPLTVSGSVFWLDGDSDGSVVPPLVSNVVVDLWDCSNEESQEGWLLMTRTDESGNYQFMADGDDGEDIGPTLSGKNVTQFRAVFSLPTNPISSSGETVVFSSPSKDSDVDPTNGQTACWDLDIDGRFGSIVWNAGMTTLDATATTASPTTHPSSLVTTDVPTVTPVGGVIGGYAFLDVNDDGIDSISGLEPPMTNIVVQLYSCTPPDENTNAADIFAGGSNDRLLNIDQTTGGGFYSFPRLFVGYYKVKVNPPDGYRLSSTWTGSDASVDNAVNQNTKSTECFQLSDGGGGTPRITWNIGLVALEADNGDNTNVNDQGGGNSTISGFVFSDVNNNGYLEDGDNALSNVQIALFDCSGKEGEIGATNNSTIYQVTASDINGMYGFENIAPGEYFVTFLSSSGYKVSDVWNGGLDEEGKLAAPDAHNGADPVTGSSICQKYQGGVQYTLDAGMFLPPTPTAKPVGNPGGDGTPCSGAPCSTLEHCRNKAGLCGTGIGFCNPNSVWKSGCPEKADPPAPTAAAPSTRPPRPTAAPVVLFDPKVSVSPSAGPTFNSPSMCNADGSVGDTIAGVQSAQISFMYAIKSEDGVPVSNNLVANFEDQLQARIACIYFDADDPCLSCGNDRISLASGTKRKRRVLFSQSRRLQVDDSSVMGLSSLPVDVLNNIEVCADSQSPYSCRVVDGAFTVYFPISMGANEVARESKQMLDVVSDELGKDNWDGMEVSYNNAPFETTSQLGREDQNKENDDGLSTGAIVGIVFGLLALVAVAVMSVLYIRHKRDKDDEDMFERQHQQQKAIVPFGGEGAESLNGDEYESDSAEDDSSQSSSSSSEQDDTLGSESNGYPMSAVSGDTYRTDGAQAMPNEIDDDEDTTDSSDEEDANESIGDEDFYEEEVDEQYDEEDDEQVDKASDSMMSQQNIPRNSPRIQQRLSNEDPAVYEDDQYRGDDDYPDDGYDVVEDQQNYYDEQHNGYDEGHREGEYPQEYYDSGNGEHMTHDEVNDGDPPGTSYRDLDLPQQEQWDNNVMMAPPNQTYDQQQVVNGPRSFHSAHSNTSSHSHGSRHSGQSNRSHYSQDENRQNYRRYDDNDSSNNDAYGENENYVSNEEYQGHQPPQNSHQSNGSRYYGRSRSHNSHEEDNQRNHERYNDDDYQGQPTYDDDQYDAEDGNVTHQHSEGVPRDTYDDHLNLHALPEELDEVSHAGSAYTAVTAQVSNTKASRKVKKERDSEESINDIFESLSAIQNRLAERNPPPLPAGALTDSDLATRYQSKDGYAPSYQPPTSGWGDGVVEDASMDGSQASNIATTAGRNQRPRNGQWMEPVDED